MFTREEYREEGSMEIIVILIIFSIVQSILGVGLLVFGTPTLMLLGYSFENTLSIVLPASIMISTLQVIDGRELSKNIKNKFNLYTLPFVLIGLVLVLKLEVVFNLKYVVGTMLLVTGIIRLNKKLTLHLSTFIKRFEKIYLVLLGLIHGVSNMGGGFLTIFSSSISDGEKEKTRSIVAYGYLLMGLIQLITIYIINFNLLTIEVVLYIFIAFVSYKLLGKRVFNITSTKIYNNLLTSIILFYGITIVLK